MVDPREIAHADPRDRVAPADQMDDLRRVERKKTTIDLRAGLPQARRDLIVGQLEQPSTRGRGRAHERPFPADRDVTPRPGAARAELDGRDGLVRGTHGSPSVAARRRAARRTAGRAARTRSFATSAGSASPTTIRAAIGAGTATTTPSYVSATPSTTISAPPPHALDAFHGRAGADQSRSASARHGASIPPSTWKNVPTDRARSHDRTSAPDSSSRREKNGPSNDGRTTRAAAAAPADRSTADALAPSNRRSIRDRPAASGTAGPSR